MQKYLIKQFDNSLDLLDFHADYSEWKLPFELHTTRLEKRYDVEIVSAHEPVGVTEKSSAKSTTLVTVISYVPSVDDPRWINFYTNVWRSPIIACSTQVHEKLKEIAMPDKMWINLDGCGVTVSRRNKVPKPLQNIDANKVHYIYNADASSLFWGKFKDFLKDKPEYQEVDRPYAFATAISFTPICPVLGNFISNRANFSQYGIDPDTAHYFDGRNLHRLNESLSKIITMIGSVSAKPINDGFTEFLSELESLRQHQSVNKIEPYSSSVTIPDRIFNIINRFAR